MRQVKGNIFNGDSYKAIFARVIYKRLMSREWVTLAEIMSDYLVKPCENLKGTERSVYKALCPKIG